VFTASSRRKWSVQSSACFFQDEGAWLKLAYRAHELRDHVAGIVLCPVLATQAEGLAGRPSRHQVHIPIAEGVEGHQAHIALVDPPVANARQGIRARVATERLAGVTVPLEKPAVMEVGEVRAKGQSTCPGEQLDGVHMARSMSVSLMKFKVLRPTGKRL
jgi:hypothetical protein